MSFHVIRALSLRYLYLYFRNPVRLVELFFWPVMDMLVWGNLSLWLSSAHGGGSAVPMFVPWLIGGVILWDVLFRAQQAVAISFLEDVWTRNLLNIFAAPIRPVEYVTAGFAVGVLRITVTVCTLAALGALAFKFNLLQLHWHIVPFFGMLMLFGWSLGMLSSALIMRWGQGAETLAWAVPFLIQPLAAVYYPVSILPQWAQNLSWLLPCTPVFEGMRNVLQHGVFQGDLMLRALIANVVWMLLAASVYLWVLRSGRRNGTLTRVTSH